MSLEEFAADNLTRGEASDFVVKKDLLDSYTEWRQKRQPTMQLTDLFKAQQDVDLVVPYEDFEAVLTVTHPDGRTGQVDESYHGWRLLWPGGNKTQPELTAAPLDVSDSEMTGPAVHYCFHFLKGYDRQVLNNYLVNRVSSSPANVAGLDLALQAAVDDVQRSLKALHSAWSMKTISYEGMRFNVFCARQPDNLLRSQPPVPFNRAHDGAGDFSL